MGGLERGGFIYPRVNEAGTDRSLFYLKDIALGSINSQTPGFLVEGCTHSDASKLALCIP